MEAIVSFKIQPPCACTEEQFLSWIRFEIGMINQRPVDPLTHEDFPVSFISDLSNFDAEVEIHEED